MAEKIAAAFPKKIDIECRFLTNEVARRSRLVPDITFASETLGLACTVDLETAIRRTILWNQTVKMPTENELIDERV